MPLLYRISVFRLKLLPNIKQLLGSIELFVPRVVLLLIFWSISNMQA